MIKHLFFLVITLAFAFGSRWPDKLDAKTRWPDSNIITKLSTTLPSSLPPTTCPPCHCQTPADFSMGTFVMQLLSLCVGVSFFGFSCYWCQKSKVRTRSGEGYFFADLTNQPSTSAATNRTPTPRQAEPTPTPQQEEPIYENVQAPKATSSGWFNMGAFKMPPLIVRN